MRYLSLFLLPLLFAFNVSAQKTFSQKDFNKLKQLAGPWSIHANGDRPIYEEWQLVNDTLLTGMVYRISGDTNYLPEASMILAYTNKKISIDHTYLYANDIKGTTYSLDLQGTGKGEYYFEIADSISTAARKHQKENLCGRIIYDFSTKNQIKANRMYVIPGKGLFTDIYVFKKDETKKRDNQ